MKHIIQSKQNDISILYIQEFNEGILVVLPEGKLINNTYKHNWNRYTITND